MTATIDKLYSFTVEVHDGKLRPTTEQQEQVRNYLQRFNGKVVKISIGPRSKGRSGQQNRYLWGVVYSAIAAETGHSPEEIHDACKAMFLPRDFIAVGRRDIEVTKSTTKLSTVEFSDYVERIRSWAGTELRLSIPSPEDI